MSLSSCVHQQLNHSIFITNKSVIKCGMSFPIHKIYICVRIQEAEQYAFGPVLGSIHQCSHLVVASGIDVTPSVDEDSNHLFIVSPSCIHNSVQMKRHTIMNQDVNNAR